MALDVVMIVKASDFEFDVMDESEECDEGAYAEDFLG